MTQPNPHNPYQPAQGLDPQGLFEMARRQTPKGRPQQPAPRIEELQPHFPELQLHSLIGQGGMGAVYRAHQPDLGRDIALKVLPRELGQDPGFAERFAREARVLARLDHPNVVPVYNFGQREDWCFLTMALVEGMNLRQMLQLGRMQPEEALNIVPQLCAALGYAHAQGIVHRDIKPENILIDGQGRVRIVDFGLAKLVDDGAGHVTLTGSDQIMGTPQYMAPEQVSSPLAVDHRADIYSLGVVFYEMLTGALPMGHFAPPSKRSGVGPGVDEVVMRSLAQAPEDRYQQAQEVEEELAAARQTRPPTPVGTARRSGTRLHPALRWGLACMLLAFAAPVVSAFFYWSLAAPGVEAHEMGAGPELPDPPTGEVSAEEMRAYNEEVQRIQRAWTQREMDQEAAEIEAQRSKFALVWVYLGALGLLPFLGSLCGSRGLRGIRSAPDRWHGLGLGVFLSWTPILGALTVAVAFAMGAIGDSIDDQSNLAAALAVLGAVLCVVLGIRAMVREARRLEAETAAA